MQRSNDQVRNELTPVQKAKPSSATPQDPKAVELEVEELEERVAPRRSP